MAESLLDNLGGTLDSFGARGNGATQDQFATARYGTLT